MHLVRVRQPRVSLNVTTIQITVQMEQQIAFSEARLLQCVSKSLHSINDEALLIRLFVLTPEVLSDTDDVDYE